MGHPRLVLVLVAVVQVLAMARAQTILEAVKGMAVRAALDDALRQTTSQQAADTRDDALEQTASQQQVAAAAAAVADEARRRAQATRTAPGGRMEAAEPETVVVPAAEPAEPAGELNTQWSGSTSISIVAGNPQLACDGKGYETWGIAE